MSETVGKRSALCSPSMSITRTDANSLYCMHKELLSTFAISSLSLLCSTFQKLEIRLQYYELNQYDASLTVSVYFSMQILPVDTDNYVS